MRTLICTVALLTLPLSLAACERQAVNPPTEPAAAPAGDVVPPPKGGPRPGTGAESFVGSWAAEASWCANTTDPERPIQITTTRFEGYENSCAINAIQETVDGYVASLGCMAEGMTSTERVRMAVTGQTLNLTYLDREGASSVALTRCGPPIQNPPEDSPPINGPQPTG